MRIVAMSALALAAVGLSACVVTVPEQPVQPDQASAAPADFAVFGTGFPNPGDPCRRAGESAFTGQFLDDAADLVACPPGFDAETLVANFGAREVARRDFWRLFSVPRR